MVIYLKLERFWTVSRLLNSGYLNTCIELLKHICISDKYLVERMSFMEDIKKHGMHIDKVIKKPIENIHILCNVHNSLPYDKAGYAIRTHTIVTNLYKNNIKVQVVTRPGYPWDIQKNRDLERNNKTDIIDCIKYTRLSDER